MSVTALDRKSLNHEDFLWLLSSGNLEFLGLSIDVREVEVLVVGDLVAPHHKDDFEPFCCQGT